MDTPQTDRPNAMSQLLDRYNYRLDIDQVQKAVKSQCNGRAVGVCGIPSELYKFGSENLHRCLLLLFNLILNKMTTPKDFTTSIIVPLTIQDREATRYVLILLTSQSPLHGKTDNDISSTECMQA